MQKIRIILFLLLSVFSTASFSLIPKVEGYSIRVYGNGVDKTFIGVSRAEVCAAFGPFYVETQRPGQFFSETLIKGVRCYVRYSSEPGGTISEQGLEFSNNRPLVCPDNSSASGSNCQCNDGYKENKEGNACEKPDACEGLADYCESLRSKSDNWSMKGNKDPALVCMKPQEFVPCIGCDSSDWKDRFPGCDRGCLLQSDGFSMKYKDDDEDEWFTNGRGKYQGSDCSPKDIEDTEEGEDPEEEELTERPKAGCKVGEYSGYVNGVKVCIKSNEKEEKIGDKKEKLPNGDEKITDTNVKCKNGICIVEKETKTYEKETKEIIERTSSEQSMSEEAFCRRYPTSGICKQGQEREETEVEKKEKEEAEKEEGEGEGSGDSSGTGNGSGSGTGTGNGSGSGSGSGSGDGSGSGNGNGNEGSSGSGGNNSGSGSSGTGSDSGGSNDGSGSGTGTGNGKGSSFGGGCDTGFTCDGDAVQCAIAMAEQQQACMMRPADPGDVLDGTDDESASALQEQAEEISVGEFNSSGYGWSRSCPADPEFSIMGSSFKIPFSEICGIMGLMSNLALAITALGLLAWIVRK